MRPLLSPIAPLWPAALLVGWLGSGCSLRATDLELCTATEQCHEAFGIGSMCGSDGVCTTPTVNERCTRTFPADLFEREDRGEFHVVGTLYSYTEHLPTLQATELAFQQVNERAGLDGRPFGLVHCDTTDTSGDQLDSVEASVAGAAYLTENVGVPAIIGPRGSSRTEAAFTRIRDAGVVMISPSSTSPALTTIDNVHPSDETPGYLWRTVPPDSLQSRVIAQDMRSRGVERVAVAYQTGAYGDDLKTLFVSEFERRGGETVLELPFSSAVSEVVAALASGLERGLYTEILLISSDLADYKTFLLGTTATSALQAAYLAPGVGLFFPDAAFSASLIEDTGSKAEAMFAHIRGTRPAPADGLLFNAFAAAFLATYQIDPSIEGFAPQAYDAAWLTIAGAAWSHARIGAVTGVELARGLRKLSAGTPVEIRPSSWPEIERRFGAGSAINMVGTSGSLDFDPRTEETTAPISVWGIVPDAGAPTGYSLGELSRQEPEPDEP